MTYKFGFIDRNLNYMAAFEACRETMERGLFHSWYEYSEPQSHLLDSIDTALRSLPSGFIFLSRDTILERGILKRCSELDLNYSVSMMQEERGDLGLFRDWVCENKYSFFLTDITQAFVLYRAQGLLEKGYSVVLANDIPYLKDLQWQLTGVSFPREMVASQTANWCVVDECVNMSAHMLALRYPRLTPNFFNYGDIFVSYVRHFQFDQQSSFLRSLGAREVRGDFLGRYLDPVGFVNARPFSCSQYESCDLLSRTGNHARCYSPISRYYKPFLYQRKFLKLNV